MIDWWIGDKHNFKISVGKGKSRYKDLLLEETYEIYKNTYPSLETENIMNALYQAIILFDLLASELANKYSFDYPSNLKTDIIAFLKQY
jgi:aminoglycoside 6-adenylyltransferase